MKLLGLVLATICISGCTLFSQQVEEVTPEQLQQERIEQVESAIEQALRYRPDEIGHAIDEGSDTQLFNDSTQIQEVINAYDVEIL